MPKGAARLPEQNVDDEFYGYQWHFDNSEYGGIQMEQAWELLGAPGTPGKDVIVAIVDAGTEFTNGSFANNCDFSFQCDASSNSDYIHLDEIEISVK